MSSTSAALSSALRAEAAALQALLELLRDEQHALVYGEIERVAAMAEKKAQCLFELARCGERRERLLNEHGFAPDRKGMERFIHEQAVTLPGLSAEWEQLLDLTQTAHQVNGINGTLIDTRLRMTDHALNVLFGAARIPETYAPDGRTISYSTAHSRAIA